MTRKVIVIEMRKPKTKEEKEFYGLTETLNEITTIFINADKHRGGGVELVDTLFHELCHAAVGLYKTKLTAKREEKLATLVGNIAGDLFKGA